MRSLTLLVAVVLLSGSGVAFAQTTMPDPAAPATTTGAPTPPDAEPQVVAPPDIVQPDPTPAAHLLLPAPPTTLDAYRAEALDIRFAPFAFKSFSLQRNGQEITGSYADAFASSPEALAQYEGSRRMAIGGSVSMVIGVTAVIAGAVLLSIAYANDEPTGLGWGLVGGGAAVELIGGILMGVGAQRFNDAVDLHNTALYERLRATPR
jgi:hypothetical protein